MDTLRQLFRSIGAQPVDEIRDAWSREIGLLGVGGVLDPRGLVTAYRLGAFPWPLLGEDGPVFWCSPDPRFVLLPEEFHCPRSLEKVLRRGELEVRFDQDFESVIRSCAECKRPGYVGTWITREMIDAYIALHDLGFAHSAETYRRGKLVGGLYGVACGGVFFGESMFTTVDDASKVAFVTLVRQLTECGYRLIDCQQKTRHLARFGAVEMDRTDFLERLHEALSAPVTDCFPVPSPSSG